MSVLVIGSANTDTTLYLHRFPLQGETLTAKNITHGTGGKGANQALACARMGLHTTLITPLGNDPQAAEILSSLSEVTTRPITCNSKTGAAFILVDEAGENRIILDPGANASLTTKHILASKDYILSASFLILQLEVPIESVTTAIDIANTANIPVLLNPAPAIQLHPTLYPKIAYLILNQSEAEILTNVPVQSLEQAKAAATTLLTRGISRAVILTLASNGVVFIQPGTNVVHLPARSVTPVDTTGAGDTFIGAFVAGILESTLTNAVKLGIDAAALAITRRGAASSIPKREELHSCI